MKVILTDDVVGVGDIGEIVNVKPGYARNYLIPRGSAIETGSASAKKVAHHKRQIEAKKKQLKSGADEKAKQLAALKPELSLRVGSGGKVFGSLGARDIAAKLAESGFEVDRRRVLLGDPIKRIGTHTVKVKLHADVVAEVELNVVAAAASQAEEEQEAAAAIQAVEERFADTALEEGLEEGDEAGEELDLEAEESEEEEQS